MEENQPLEIYVKKGLGGSDVDDTNETPTDQEVKPKEKKGETDKLGKAVGAQIVNITKQALMMSIRNYGDITGRAREQQMIENVVSLSGVGATLLVSGPVIGGFVVAGASALSAMQSYTSQTLERRQKEYDNNKLGGIIKNGNR